LPGVGCVLTPSAPTPYDPGEQHDDDRGRAPKERRPRACLPYLDRRTWTRQ